MEKKHLFSFLFMYFSFFVYSLSSIFSKLASKQEFMSIKYILCFCGIILILGIYAILWQQVLRRIELSFAMANKPVVLVLTSLWGFLFFKEQITAKFIIGIIIIFCGIIVINYRKNDD